MIKMKDALEMRADFDDFDTDPGWKRRVLSSSEEDSEGSTSDDTNEAERDRGNFWDSTHEGPNHIPRPSGWRSSNPNPQMKKAEDFMAQTWFDAAEERLRKKRWTTRRSTRLSRRPLATCLSNQNKKQKA